MDIRVRHAHKHANKRSDPNKRTNTPRELPEADWCILFLKQQWEISKASLVQYLDIRSVCVSGWVCMCMCVCVWKVLHLIKRIPRSGLSLDSSKWNNSLFLYFLCLLSSQVWVFPLPSLLKLRKLIIDFIRQQGCGPLQTQNERLEGTFPEWVHFLHNPPQSSSSHHQAKEEPVWHIADYFAMLSLHVNTRWPVKCSSQRCDRLRWHWREDCE